MSDSSIPQAISSLAYDPTYNPGNSTIIYTSIYGADSMVTFDQVESIVKDHIKEGIIFGVRCGAALLTLIVMWMISKNKRTPIFIINQCSLVLIVMHSAFYFAYLLSHFDSITYNLTLFPQFISRRDVHIYGAASIFQVLLVIFIEASLIFQVRVIFRGDAFKRLGNFFLSIAVLIGLATIAMYFVTAIQGMITIYKDFTDITEQKYFNVSTILLATSINYMTIILVVKLAIAIRSRRFLGLKQFDSFHVLLIMSCQTLFVPSILFIFAYSFPARFHTDQLIAIATLLVVLSLPLSSMWASSSNNASKPSSLVTDYSSTEKSDVSSMYANSIVSTIKNKFSVSTPFSSRGKKNISDDDSSQRSENTYIDLEQNKNYTRNHRSNTRKTDQFSFDNTSMQTSLRSQAPFDTVRNDNYINHTEADEEARLYWAGTSDDSRSKFTTNKTTTEQEHLSPISSDEGNLLEDDSIIETKKITLNK